DINDLNESGFSITFDKRINSYIFTDSDFTLRDLDLNNDELTALLIGKQIAHRMGKPFEKAYQSLLKKAHKDTGIKTGEGLKKIEDKQQFFIDIDPMEGFDEIEKQYNAVSKAMEKKVEIEIGYKAMKNEKETKRTIAPYGLIFEYGLWYVIGYCNLRKGIRVFALDCIKDFKLTDKYYSIPDDFRLEEHFKPGWHMIRYGKPVEVVLKFGKEYARWIKRKKWHPTQAIEEKGDGIIIFKVTVEGTRELKWWIYHWIPYVEILSPPELRKEVMEEMRGMLRVYETKIST
ncbi:MAG: WYL domain-containing protein, partial [Nitrospinae bacterium]|nr:WYL domain-containing protein [Nitrospinota bacterium]